MGEGGVGARACGRKTASWVCGILEGATRENGMGGIGNRDSAWVSERLRKKETHTQKEESGTGMG